MKGRKQITPRREALIAANYRKISTEELATLCGVCRQTLYGYLDALGYDRKAAGIRTMVGRTSGRLTVIEDDGGRYVKVRCTCGTEFLAWRYSVAHGTTRSCGCLRDELVRERVTKWNKEHLIRKRCE